MNRRFDSAWFGVGAVVATVTLVGAHRTGEAAVSMGAMDLSLPVGSSAAIFVVVILTIFNALTQASKSATKAIKPVHVRMLRETDPKAADRLQWFVDQRSQILAANSMASKTLRLFIVFFGYLLSIDLTRTGHDQWKCPLDGLTITLVAVVVTVAIGAVNLVFAELLPTTVGGVRPQRVALRLTAFTHMVAALFRYPAQWVIGLTTGVSSRFAPSADETPQNQVEEEIKTIVASAQVTGEIESEEQELLHSVFEFTDTVAREVMTPRVDVDAAPVESDPATIVKLMRETGHSRIPLFEETDDQIVGIIHAKDLLMAMVDNRDVEVRSLMRPALFVPENKDVHELLTDMRTHRAQFAVVQDEFGGTAGIVTIEDIVEELVGDIMDEYDNEEPDVVHTGVGHVVKGGTHIDDVNDELGTSFSSDEFDTIGGFVFGLFGRQPKLGESIVADGHRFTIAGTDGRRILRLRIEPTEPEHTP